MKEVISLELKTTFANRLKVLRGFRMLTLEELSKMVDIPAQTLNRYELGQRIPKIDVVAQIASKMNINPMWLCGYSDAISEQYATLDLHLSKLGYSLLWDGDSDHSFVVHSPEGNVYILGEEELKKLQDSTEAFISYTIQDILKDCKKIK
ncbi:helix-turn-helix domain-containing protein [Ruminiclostridium cellobioparum]|uniref:helix-turn-helix domain-containing protein n=1 Tax=Ruminiclostridium cellobioparum TaxID=29355 RepID=UPI0028B1327D|nr:helix-turn-helix transcriptional regulator [Ruminiclostridium cellobioparum]